MEEVSSRITVTSKRQVKTLYGSKEAFYSESVAIPAELKADRAQVFVFLNHRLDLVFLLDNFYSSVGSDQQIPNKDYWPHIESKIKFMQDLYKGFSAPVQAVLAFNPEYFLPVKNVSTSEPPV